MSPIPPSRPRPDAPGRPAAALLAAAVGALLLAVASAAPLQDRDEPRFAQATVEMLSSGDFLVPTFNGRLRPDKPPLAYWAMAAAVRVAGPREGTFRAPSALGIALAALALWGAGRRLLGPRAALLAAGVLAATPLALAIGSAAYALT